MREQDRLRFSYCQLEAQLFDFLRNNYRSLITPAFHFVHCSSSRQHHIIAKPSNAHPYDSGNLITLSNAIFHKSSQMTKRWGSPHDTVTSTDPPDAAGDSVNAILSVK